MRHESAACLSELLSTNAISTEQLDLAVKEAAVSPDAARRSMDRLDSLEKSKPTVGQFGRYTGIGGALGAAAGAIGHGIEHGSALKGATTKAKLLNVASNTAKGALAGGVAPLLRSHTDRRAEMGTLKNFMNEDKVASAAMVGMFDRMLKEAGLFGEATGIARQGAGMVRQGVQRVAAPMTGAVTSAAGAAKNIAVGATPVAEHKNEIAGLGVLAVPGLDTLQASARARFAGDKGHDAVEKRQLLGEGAHAGLEVGGLGLLAAPSIAKLKHAFAQSSYSGNVAQNPPGARSHSQLAPFTAPKLARKESELDPKLANVEEILTKKLRAEGKSAEEADRLIGQGKVAGALSRAGELLTGSKAKALSSAAVAHAGKAKDIVKNRVTPPGLKTPADYLGHIRKTQGSALRENKAARRIGDLAGKEHRKVDIARDATTGAVTTAGAAAIIKHRQGTKKEAGVGVGAGMSTSQYSGPLSMGAFKMVSGAPPYSEPELEKKKTASFFGELTSLVKSAFTNAALGPMHAAGKLHATASVGAPRTTAPPGPSISEIAKPKGFGTPLAGTKKTTL